MKTYTFVRSATYDETYTVQAESEEEAHELVYDPRHALLISSKPALWYDDEFTLIENEETQT